MRIKWLDAKKTDGRWVGDDDEVIPDGGRVHVPLMLCDSRRNLTDTFAVDGDLAQHRPGFRLIGDQATRDSVRSARDTYVRDLQSAWKMDGRKRKPDPDDPDEDNENGDDDEQDARAKDARRLARRSQEGSRSGGPNQENNSHQGQASQGSHDRFDGERHGHDDIRRGALEARAAYVRDLQTAWKRPADPIARTYEPHRPFVPRSARDAAQPDLGTRPEEIQARRDAAWKSYTDQLSNAWKSPVGRLDPNRAGVVERERMSTTFETRSPSVSSPGDSA
jgi:hypothetical protein